MQLTPALRNHVRRHLRTQGLSFYEAALLCGVNYNTISRIVSGAVDSISARTERALCSLLRMTPQQLLSTANDASGLPTAVCLPERVSYPPDKLNSLLHQALWTWVAQDQARARVLRALGYAGELPIP